MHPVPRRGLDALPLGGVGRRVTGLAHLVLDLGVRSDLLRSLGHPEVELAEAGVGGLLMATVARERVMLGSQRDVPLERRIHDVTPGAEIVVMLGVVPGRHSHRAGRRDEHDDADHEPGLHAPLPARHPVEDSLPAHQQEPGEEDGHDSAHDHPADLHPGRHGVQQEPDDFGDSTREGRVHKDRVDGADRGLLGRRRGVMTSDGGEEQRA